MFNQNFEKCIDRYYIGGYNGQRSDQFFFLWLGGDLYDNLI